MTPVTDLAAEAGASSENWEGSMPKSPVTFEVIESHLGMYHCSICGINPATLKCSGMQEGPCCLQCAFSMLADLAQWTVDNSAG